ncbi:hypothetical protein RvY_00773-1 [Ramazzottius varieornatus]|uniref:Uncharacterized protein n=1 Tax=Ramazzottius varieornatus TaxID=947166 RepID=A0A1D1UPA6_RAMVA|nr:hypothetical protein RvY_00773-1 [Ramazzottius varieornatus]
MTSYMTSMVNTFTSLQTQMQTPIDQVNGALNADYTGKAQAGLNTLINMSAIIMDKTTPLRSQIIAKLDDVPKQFEPVLSQIDGYLVPVQEMFANQLAYMRTFTPYINSYGKYGDIAVIVIATFVLLIAIMMLLGCATGAWSFDKAVPPTQRKGAVTCGNFCLIFAVVLILLFAWIFMIVTMVFFVGGTQADASICPVLQGAPNNFTMLDDIIDFMEQRFNVTMPVLFGKKIMPGQLMLSCMNDQSLFVTLGLGSQFNITQIRDQLYSFNISGQLNSLDANLNDVVIYSSATDTQFQKILTGLSFDFNPFYAQLDVNGNPLPYVQLGWFRGNISAARATAPTPPTPVDYFDNVLAKIDAVEAQMHVVDAGRTFVSANISVLATSMVSLKLVAISTQNMAINGQTRISSGGMGAIVKQAATLFAARTFSIVDQFLDYFEGSVMTQAGKCRPAYDAVQGIASLFCDGFIKPLVSDIAARKWLFLWISFFFLYRMVSGSHWVLPWRCFSSSYAATVA